MKKNKNSNHQSFSIRRFILQKTGQTESKEDQGLADLEGKQSAKATTNSHSPSSSKHSKIEVIVYETSEKENEDYCVVCYQKESALNSFFTLEYCEHRFCCICLIKYLKNEIVESRTDIACPQCSSAMHPNNIEVLLKDYPDIKRKYEDFMIRRYLVSDPDSRWCPAPNCCYAVIATGCAPCPEIRCERVNCGTSFCYHCKAEWHPDQTCTAAKTSRQKFVGRTSDSVRKDEIKPCPRCQVLIVKMNDGSCNHMVCSVCGAEFCWLCMKEVSDLHYLSPSGCTFWGKKPWSRKKKFFWQLGTLIGAPVGIALLAGIALPSMVIGIPVWVGRKLLERYRLTTKRKRNLFVTLGVTVSILISPLLAGLAIAIGVPILLFYIYGIVPVSLCRAGCETSENEDFKFNSTIGDDNTSPYNPDQINMDGVSRNGEASIGDVSSSGTSGSLMGNSNFVLPNFQCLCRESTIALAGSVKNQPIDGMDNRSENNVFVLTSNSETISGNKCTNV